MATRSYNDAIDALNSLQTPHEVLEARRRAGLKPDAASPTVMKAYLRRIGYTPADLDRLNVIHVAGTKGKGSTCAFVDGILHQNQRRHGRPQKHGLFISPHLIAVRERIRIDAAPLAENLFACYFFEVWDRLGDSADASNEVPLGSRPLYSRFLTLLSWHVFLQEGVDVAVYETGIGGEYDATNLVEHPVATGISTLGIDHVYLLGDTVDKIAWHKVGIMKKGSRAFTVEQVPSAATVLEERAKEKGVDLAVLSSDPRLRDVRIKPDAEFQKRNATLAVALAEVALQRLDIIPSRREDLLPQEFVDGLQQTVFRGRCEVKHEKGLTWYLDGAHTMDSLKASSQWFMDETVNCPGPRVLIFNQQSRPEAVDFLAAIQAITARQHGQSSFDHAVFCTNVTHTATGYKRDFVDRQADPREVEEMTAQHRFADAWHGLDSKATVVVLRTIEEALQHARRLGSGLDEGQDVRAYVTGSLHLVGGALGILEEADAL